MSLNLDNRPPAGIYRVRSIGSILHRAEEGIAYVHDGEYPVTFLCSTGRKATFCPDRPGGGGVRIVGTEWLEMGDALFEEREAACEYLYGEADPDLWDVWDGFLAVSGGNWACRVWCARGDFSERQGVLVVARREEETRYVALRDAEPWEGLRLRGRVERSGLLRGDRGDRERGAADA